MNTETLSQFEAIAKALESISQVLEEITRQIELLVIAFDKMAPPTAEEDIGNHDYTGTPE